MVCTGSLPDGRPYNPDPDVMFPRMYSMRSKLLVILALALAVAMPPAVLAAEKKGAAPARKSGTANAGAFYRYVNDKGVTVIDSAIPPQYVGRGYDVLSRSGQLLKRVAPTAVDDPADEGEAKRRREEAAMMIRRDAELKKLYSSPQDAERLRDRQIEAITLKIDYAKGQLLQVTGKRKRDLEQAARLERAGTPVPKDVRENLDRLNAQIATLDSDIRTLEDDKVRMRTEFAPIIERLKVLYPDKAVPAPAVTTPAAAPAAAPVVPAKGTP